MEGRNKKMELLGNAPIPKALLAMGLPTMIGMMINALYNLVDAYFVGGLGTSQMGAISVAFPLGQVVVGLGLLFGNGGASYISRLLGRGDRRLRTGRQARPCIAVFLWERRSSFARSFFEAPVKVSGSNGQYTSLCCYICGYLCGVIHIQCV